MSASPSRYPPTDPIYVPDSAGPADGADRADGGDQAGLNGNPGQAGEPDQSVQGEGRTITYDPAGRAANSTGH
jgi:hypothetical protein